MVKPKFIALKPNILGVPFNGFVESTLKSGIKVPRDGQIFLNRLIY